MEAVLEVVKAGQKDPAVLVLGAVALVEGFGIVPERKLRPAEKAVV
jgi:hypothetical protein